jgi:1-acyl-sn-glycerol-3-phosphate acyltransferase
MSSWTLLVLSVLVLLTPRLFVVRGRPGSQADRKPEIHGVLTLCWLVIRFYCFLWHRLVRERWAPLPEHGPAILISNHTCGIDHLVLQASSRRVLGFVIAREYYEWRWLRFWCELVGCIPVNRNGRDLAAIRAALKALKEGRVLPVFPEGHILPTSGRQLAEMKPGTAYLAIRAQVPVVPAFIAGTPQTDQITTSMLTPSRAKIFFGEPIDLSDISPEAAGDRAVQAVVSERFRSSLLKLQSRAFAAESGAG